MLTQSSRFELWRVRRQMRKSQKVLRRSFDEDRYSIPWVLLISFCVVSTIAHLLTICTVVGLHPLSLYR